MPTLVPTYDLYGERLSHHLDDPVHHERIRDRSERHSWTIRPHRHDGLAQLFLFRSGGVRITAGGLDLDTTGPAALLVPPRMVHGFRFPAETAGDVVTLPLDQQSPAIRARLQGQAMALLRGPADPPHFDGLVATVDQIAHLFPRFDPERRALLASLAETLTLYALAERQADDGAELGDARASALCALVETGYSGDLSVADCARALDLSPTHLTRLSRRYLGVPPGELILRRRMLEARRLLRDTRQTVAQIGPRCGYRDPAYFVRVFSRAHGIPPGRYRKNGHAGLDPADAQGSVTERNAG
ncbi:MAG: helix-turn-helix domain-containing protein [Pseudomonadota bacterium]